MTHPAAKLANVRRRAARARRFCENTCPASRHLHMIADDLSTGKWPTFWVEPQHAAESIYSVLEALWKARTELAKLKGKK